MQQPPSMIPMVPSFPPANLTTEQIQKYLDENKKLIVAILDNQNLGKLAECAQYQAQLQKNLMYLAAIADAQPQTSSTPVQVTPRPAMSQGGFYMQQQPGVFSPKMPIQFSNPQQVQEQVIQAQMVNRPVGPSNGNNPKGSGIGGGPLNTSGLYDRNKQDAKDAGRVDGDGQGGGLSGLTIGPSSEEAK